jgi:ribosome-associated protein
MSDDRPKAKTEVGRNKPQRVESAERKAVLCAQQAAQFKALDLVLLDVSGFSSFSDFFVICSGKSSRQVQGIADNLETSLSGMGLRPLGVEGRREGHWILMDYGDVIIHIFYEPVRYFYDLESLWSDAARVQWEENTEVTNPNLG